MKFLTKVKTVAHASVWTFGKSLLNKDAFVVETSLSPKIPKILGYTNIAAHTAARNARFMVVAKPLSMHAWKAAIIADAVSYFTSTACRKLDKENYQAASLRYVVRHLATMDELEKSIIAVKEAA